MFSVNRRRLVPAKNPSRLKMPPSPKRISTFDTPNLRRRIKNSPRGKNPTKILPKIIQDYRPIIRKRNQPRSSRLNRRRFHPTVLLFPLVRNSFQRLSKRRLRAVTPLRAAAAAKITRSANCSCAFPLPKRSNCDSVCRVINFNAATVTLRDLAILQSARKSN